MLWGKCLTAHFISTSFYQTLSQARGKEKCSRERGRYAKTHIPFRKAHAHSSPKQAQRYSIRYVL